MRAWLVVLLLAACGGDNLTPCRYVEAHDPGNASTPEDTGLAVGPGAPSVCGAIDGGHFDPRVNELDLDRYRVTVGGSGQVLVEVTAEPGVELLDQLAVRLFQPGTPPTLVGEGALRPDLADHAAYVATVPPGDVEVAAAAYASSDVAGSLGYRIRLSADPEASCPAGHGTPRYREAHDGGGATGNDVIAVDFAHDPAFAMTGGTPEPTGLTIDGGQRYLIAGRADGGQRGEAYLDRDTYALSTGDYADELAVRVDWDDPGADLDFVMFEASTLVPVATSTRSGTTGPEYQVFAVQPDSAYWLWVGRFDAPGTTAAAADYRVTVCGGNFY